MKIKRINGYWGGTWQVTTSVNELVLIAIMLLGAFALIANCNPEPINKKTEAATSVKHNINL